MAFLKTRKGIISTFFIIFIAMMGIGAFLGGQLNNMFFESVETKEAEGKPINILFMGIDARDAKSNSRSDVMIVASVDPATKKIAMVSVPRDTRIKSSFGKYEKINSVNYVNGPEAACKEVGKLLNTRVDYYVVTNFGGFGDIVDALGGVHINVDFNTYMNDFGEPVNLSKGYQYLNGQQALTFVRYRGGPTADIGRTENQQKFIKALADEMLQSKTILKLPQLIPQLTKNIRTNLPIKDIIYLAEMAQKLDVNNITAQTVPGYFYYDYATGASYWEADKKIASTLIEGLLKGETFKVICDAPAQPQPSKPNPITAAVQKKVQELAPAPVTPVVEQPAPVEPPPPVDPPPDPTPQVVTTITVSGPESVTIPATNTTANYTAIVADQFGKAMTDKTVTWSLQLAVTGVSINSNTGEVKVDNAAAAAAGSSFTVVAKDKDGSVTGSKTVNLTAPTPTPEP